MTLSFSAFDPGVTICECTLFQKSTFLHPKTVRSIVLCVGGMRRCVRRFFDLGHDPKAYIVHKRISSSCLERVFRTLSSMGGPKHGQSADTFEMNWRKVRLMDYLIKNVENDAGAYASVH